ncbi:ROK family protein [Omnitrophica bacterium]|nr:ROK family protein [Candidatus Omnitrophota bacterium]
MSKKGKKYYIGIDLGGTKILTALLNRKFEVIAEVKLKVDAHRGLAPFLKEVEGSVEELLDDQDAKRKHVAAIGVGCPGAIKIPEGTVTVSPNLVFLKNVPLRKKLHALLKRPVWVENDVNAGLFGEQQFGAAKGHSHVVGIFLGTGVGGALILNGTLYRGALGAAGEIGHTFLQRPDDFSFALSSYTLEGSVGRHAITSEAALLMLKQKAPYLYKNFGFDLKKIKSKALQRSIRAKDRGIQGLIRAKAGLLGVAMANAVNLLNPELIVLGGGLVEAMSNEIVPAARRSMKAYALEPLAKIVKVVPAKLKDYSIVKGAAKLAADSVAHKI